MAGQPKNPFHPGNFVNFRPLPPAKFPQRHWQDHVPDRASCILRGFNGAFVEVGERVIYDVPTVKELIDRIMAKLTN